MCEEFLGQELVRYKCTLEVGLVQPNTNTHKHMLDALNRVPTGLYKVGSL